MYSYYKTSELNESIRSFPVDDINKYQSIKDDIVQAWKNPPPDGFSLVNWSPKNINIAVIGVSESRKSELIQCLLSSLGSDELVETVNTNSGRLTIFYEYYVKIFLPKIFVLLRDGQTEKLSV